MAEERRQSSLFAKLFELFSILFEEAIDSLVAPFVMGARMNDDGPVCFSIQVDGTLKGFVVRCWPFGAIGFIRQGADVEPSVGLVLDDRNFDE